MHRVERLALPAASPGARTDLVVHRFGTPGARPKAYLQAALHADETPGLLVAHHLLRALEAADQAGGIVGELVLVPFANPIGLGQNVLGSQVGRSSLEGGGNFNRGFPDLTQAVAAAVADRLTDDAAGNVAVIRAALPDLIRGQAAATVQDRLRLTLMELAADSDIIIDLHSDLEALLHLYVANWLPEPGAQLSADIGSHVTMSAEVYGNFDHACGTLWLNLGRHFGAARPVPPALFVATIELRGRADVDDPTAARDAAGILRFLTRRGVLRGDAGALPRALCAVTPYDAVASVTTPVAGVVTYPLALGAAVTAGTLIAEIIDPAAASSATARHPILAPCDGIYFTRRHNKLVRPGDQVAKIAGAVAAAGGRRQPIGG